MNLSKYTELHWVGGALAASAISFLYVGTGGWPGAAHECVAVADCYCEAQRVGLIAQPANTWSCLGWGVAGLWIAWNAARQRECRAPLDPELDPYQRSFYTGIYALVVFSLVPGGMFFHASLTDWGGKLDIVSMYLLVNFWLFYNLARSFRWSRTTFLIAYATTTAILLVPRVIYSAIDIGLSLFVGLIFLALTSEIWLASAPHRRWVWVGLGSFVFAHLVQAALPCDPNSLFQPHAVLHVIEVVPLVAFYFHFFGAARLPITAAPPTA